MTHTTFWNFIPSTIQYIIHIQIVFFFVVDTCQFYPFNTTTKNIHIQHFFFYFIKLCVYQIPLTYSNYFFSLFCIIKKNLNNNINLIDQLHQLSSFRLYIRKTTTTFFKKRKSLSTNNPLINNNNN